MDYSELINLLLPQLIPAILSVLGVFGAFLGKKFVELYAKHEQAVLIEKIVKQTVDYVEQLSKIQEIADKKQLAIDKAIEYAQSKGVEISEVELDIMIESFVSGLKTADAIVDDKPVVEPVLAKAETEIFVEESVGTE